MHRKTFSSPAVLRFIYPHAMLTMVNQKTESREHTNAVMRRRHQTTPGEALEFSVGRVRDVAALRGLGFSYREIASYYGVTPQAISLLLARSRKQMKAIGGDPQLATLSTRATSTLRRLGITTREDALKTDAMSRLAYARNCGRKTREEIERWAAEAKAV